MPSAKRKASGSQLKGNKKAKTKDVSDVSEESEVEKTKENENETDMKAALKILCWNVNGVRAWLKKETTINYIKKHDPDIVCFQEVKCAKQEIPDALKKSLSGYEFHWLTGEKAGYAGVAVMTRKKPISVTNGLGKAEHDGEGRVITAEFDNFYLVNAYVPNSGRGLPRLDYRTNDWEPTMRDYLKKLDGKKPVIMCGDLNVAHREIDLANPKTNLKTAGFTPRERAEFDQLLKLGFVDVFRHFYPDKKGAYTFWSARGASRENNIGWRLDYFVVSQRFMPKMIDCVIGGKAVVGSDHCPLHLFVSS